MRDALAILQRIRHHKKKGAERAFAEAEKARQIQEERVDGLTASVDASREGETSEDEACWVAQAQAWRLKMEVQLRRERGRLNERTHEAANRKRSLTHANREHRVVERAIENIDERRKIADRKAEARRLDAMGTSRWQRKEG